MVDEYTHNQPRKALIFTKHAKERVYEAGLDIPRAKELYRESLPDKPSGFKLYKREKYGGNQNVFYRRNGTFIFTVADTKDKMTGQPILLVITFSDQRITAGSLIAPEGLSSQQ